MALVIYDSAYGNTKRIAAAIAETLGVDTPCMAVDDMQVKNLQTNLVVVGCPINAWHPTPKVAKFLTGLAPQSLAGIKVAAFDTRIDSFFSGNAAKKIAKALVKAGASLVAPPQGFYVKGTKGPLVEGEIEKAKSWANLLMQLAAK